VCLQLSNTCNNEGCYKSRHHKCANCKLAFYCCKDCQVEDWSARHKRVCKCIANAFAAHETTLTAALRAYEALLERAQRRLVKHSLQLFIYDGRVRPRLPAGCGLKMRSALSHVVLSAFCSIMRVCMIQDGACLLTHAQPTNAKMLSIISVMCGRRMHKICDDASYMD